MKESLPCVLLSDRFFRSLIAPLSTIAEEALVAGLRSRNRTSLEYLYDHYAAALLGVISRIITDPDLAEEVLQDAFLRIWERIDQYDASKGRLFTWMLNISRHLAIDRTRSKDFSKGRKTDALEKLVSPMDGGAYTETSVESIGLKEVLNALPAEQRFVIEKVYLSGYTHAELAEESGIPLGTIKTRARAAMTLLRTILKVN